MQPKFLPLFPKQPRFLFQTFSQDSLILVGITSVNQNQIDQFIEDTGLDIGFGETRRNIVTKHLRLNALVGKEFVIGEARLLGTELCEPCASLGKRLSNTRLTPREIVKAFTHKAGIRAKIIASGSITPGTLIQTI